MLEGKIERQGFLDIIQLLTMSRKTGRLKIGGTAEGELYFTEGEIIDCHMGKLVGDDAFIELFILVSGNFKFHEEDIKLERRMTKSLTDLLMAASKQATEWDSALNEIAFEDAAIVLAPVDPDAENHFKLDSLGWALISQVNGRRSLPEIARLLGQPKTRVAITLAKLKKQGLVTIEGSESALLRTIFRKTSSILYHLIQTRVKKRSRERVLTDFNKWAFSKGFDIRILDEEGVVNNISHDLPLEQKTVAYRQVLEHLYEAAQSGVSRAELEDYMGEIYEKLKEEEKRCVGEHGLSKFIPSGRKRRTDNEDFWSAADSVGPDGLLPR
jgi:hypothetical protein